MVKVKKNIRRRHANKVRFKLKNRSRYKKVSLCREVTATGDKEGWDYNKTLKQNMEALGLQLHSKPQASTAAKKRPSRGVEIADLPPLLAEAARAGAAVGADATGERLLNRRNPKRHPFFVSEDEAQYLDRLVAKHGADYRAMFRDIKLNNMQHTEAHLRARCQRLAKYREATAAEAKEEAAAAAAAAERSDEDGAGDSDASGSGGAAEAPESSDEEEEEAPAKRTTRRSRRKA